MLRLGSRNLSSLYAQRPMEAFVTSIISIALPGGGVSKWIRAMGSDNLPYAEMEGR
jgi:hypothetical protein